MISKISKSNPNFTSVPISCVNLRKLENGVEAGVENAVFSVLNPHDVMDRQAIQEIWKNWMHCSPLFNQICREFLNPNIKNFDNYNVIELLGKNKLSERIVGIARSTVDNASGQSRFHLGSLVVKPELIAQSKERKLKGVGEVLLASLFKQAEKIKSSCFEFYSANDNFYYKIFKNAGMKFENTGDEYTLLDALTVVDNPDFNKYTNYCQKKYDFKFDI